jgi:uncharacterized damage-inducible protein DinB
MIRKVITLLSRYNQAANEKMNAIIQTLSPAEWEQDLGGYFNSIRRLCSHVYICDYSWIKRFSALRAFSVFGDGFFKETYSVKDVLFPTKEEYLSRRPALDKKLIDFCVELTDADLAKSLRYTDFKGKELEKNICEALLQFLNHETHHRGMISLDLERLGRENDFNSILPLVQSTI